MEIRALHKRARHPKKREGRAIPFPPEPPILHARRSTRMGCPRARAPLVAAGPAISSEARNSNPTRKPILWLASSETKISRS